MIFDIVVSDEGANVGERKTTKTVATSIGRKVTDISLYPFMFTNRTDDELSAMFTFVTRFLKDHPLSHGVYIGVPNTKALCNPTDCCRCKHCPAPAVEYADIEVRRIDDAAELEYLNTVFRNETSGGINTILTQNDQRYVFPQILRSAIIGLWMRPIIEADSADDAADKLIGSDCDDTQVFVIRIKNIYIAYRRRNPGLCNNVSYHGARQAGLVTSTRSREELKEFFELILNELEEK